MKKQEKTQYVIVCDGWIPDRYFELNERDEMMAYLNHCRRNYQGQWDYKEVRSGFPRRLLKAITTGKP